ncbi:hypothetical protein N24_1805 [Corynebacterium suranareeae]|uniref:Uncharacterized protein n=1 Tax=Corynebacterium suranareeae TaxID=2506452 RepID=A0A160PPU7_9CORY|nr:hypothetical protein [Corynebacterium suranareeae]BAU96067.1 hypothetical protein N24_1805 [Corynebacterium suranareeae]
MTIPQEVLDSPEYRVISAFYDGQSAARTGLPYIKHIDEGLAVLDRIHASLSTRKAYCLHPIFQGTHSFKDLEGKKNATPIIVGVNISLADLDPLAVIYATEYRHTANNHLVKHHTGPDQKIALSPLHGVNDMLIADKIQNYADFMKYHYGAHTNSDNLHAYFLNWHRHLGVDFHDFADLWS